MPYDPRNNPEPRVDVGSFPARPVNPSMDGLFYISPAGIFGWDAVAGVWRGASGSSSNTLNLYADAVNGNDANPGTTPALAVKTVTRMAQLYNSIPYYAGLFHLNFAPGTYTLDPETSFLLPGRQGNINNASVARLDAQCLTFVGGYADHAGVRTSTGVSANSITDNTLVDAPDTLVGFRIRMTTGAATGRTFCIARNQAGGVLSTLTNPTSTPVVAPGDKFVIERPNVLFQGSGPNNTQFTFYGGGNVAMIGVQIDQTQVAAFAQTIFSAETCMFTFSIVVGIENTHTVFRTINTVDPTIPFASNVINDSVGSFVSFGGLFSLFNAQFNGAVVMRGGATILLSNSSACTPDAVDNPDGQILVQNGCQFNPSNFSVRSRVQFFAFTAGAIGTIASYDISNPGNLALMSDSNSHVEIDDVTIDGNCLAQDSSSIESTTRACTITGSIACFENSIADFDGATVSISAAADAVHLEHGSRLLLRNGTVHSMIDHAIFASEGSEVNLDACTVTSDTATGIECNRFSLLILTNTTVNAPGAAQTGVILSHMSYGGIIGGAGANPVTGAGQDWLIDGTAKTNALAAAGFTGPFNSRVDDGA